MPELPEVETTKCGIQPHIEQQRIKLVVIRKAKLRWPLSPDLAKKLAGKKIIRVTRRAKYILIYTEGGNLILHLGMSGSLRILNKFVPPQKHDHVDIQLTNNKILRFTDPRRFGALLWTKDNPEEHPLLINLGPEPFDKTFSAKYLLQRAQRKSIAIKSFLMDNKNVVGIGNIYATEILYLTNLHPLTPAKALTLNQWQHIVKASKQVLRKAIKQGGTTLKDFVKSDGKPGYFVTQLQAYGRAGLPCFKCKSIMQAFVIGQRTTTFCPTCQKSSESLQKIPLD